MEEDTPEKTGEGSGQAAPERGDARRSAESGGVNPEELTAKLLELKAEQGGGPSAEADHDPEEKKGDVQPRVPYTSTEEPYEEEEEDDQGGEEEVENEEWEALRIDIEGISVEEEFDARWGDDIEICPLIYGNILMFLPGWSLRKRRRPPGEEEGGAWHPLQAQDADLLTTPQGFQLDVESVYWKGRLGCGRCPSQFNCTCGLGLAEIVKNLAYLFQLVIIPDSHCPRCIQVIDVAKNKRISFCQLNIEDLDQQKREELKSWLENLDDDGLLTKLAHHWSHSGQICENLDKELTVTILNEKILLPSTSEFFDIILIGTGSAAEGICLEAERLQARLCLIECQVKSHAALWGWDKTDTLLTDTLHQILIEAVDVRKALKHGRYNGISGTEQVFFDWDAFRSSARSQVEAAIWERRVALQKKGVLYLEGFPKIIDRNTVQVGLCLGDKVDIRGKSIILALDKKLKYDHFPGLHRYCLKLENIPWWSSLGTSKVLLVGGGVSLLEYGAIFSNLDLEVAIMLSDDFPIRYDRDVLKILMDYMQEEGVKFLSETKIHCVGPVPCGANGLPSVPGVTQRYMVIGRNTRNGKYSQHFFDHVIVLPREVSSCPLEGLPELNIHFDKHDDNIIKVNSNFRTSVSSIYCIGSSLRGMGMSRKSFKKIGNYLVQYVLGKIESVPPWDLKLGLLSSRPEYAYYGWSEAEARRIHGSQNIVVYHSTLKLSDLNPTVPNMPPAYVKLICLKRIIFQRPIEDVIGLHLLGRQCASDIVRGFALPLSEGLTKGELDRLLPLHYTTAKTLIDLEIKKNENDPPLYKRNACCQEH